MIKIGPHAELNGDAWVTVQKRILGWATGALLLSGSLFVGGAVLQRDVPTTPFGKGNAPTDERSAAEMFGGIMELIGLVGMTTNAAVILNSRRIAIGMDSNNQ